MSQQIDSTIIIKGDLAQVFAMGTDWERFPEISEAITSVILDGDRTSRWTVRGPEGRPVEWQAETTTLEPNQRIAWNSREGHIKTSGQATFTQLAHGETQVSVTLLYGLGSGAPDGVAALVAPTSREVVLDAVRHFLRAFKRHAERRLNRASP